MIQRTTSVLAAATFLLVLGGCGSKGGVQGDKGEAGAKVVLQKLKDDPKTLASLKPSEADLKELFDDSVIEPMKSHVEGMYNEVKSVDLKEDPTIHCYDAEEIKAWKDIQSLPGGYQRMGDKLKPGVTVCSFKTGSTSWDGLMWVGGRWFFVAKPFRAVEKK